MSNSNLPEDRVRQRVAKILANTPPLFVQRRRVQERFGGIIEAIIAIEKATVNEREQSSSFENCSIALEKAIDILANCEKSLQSLVISAPIDPE